MHKFKDRIKYYLIGFGIGILSIAFFFGERGCAWLPENRVKNTIAENELVYGDSIKAIMTCDNIAISDIYDLLNSSGDVDFSESNPQLDDKEYVFYGPDDLKVRFALYEGYSELIAIESNCTVSESNSHKQTIPLPAEIVTSIIESHDFMYYPSAECEMHCYDLDSLTIESFHKSATINMDKSIAWPKKVMDDDQVINKQYYLEGEIKGAKYDVLYEIGENRTRIKHIIGSKGTCGC